MGSEQEPVSEAFRWTEREEASAWGVRLREALAINGYAAEVRLRLTGECYQVVLVGEGRELTLERPEQVKFVIAQARSGAL